MDNKHNSSKDDLYLKIWEIDKDYMKTRWTVTTFFMSVSFAILGFSLQSKAGSVSMVIAQHIAALVVYWFAYFLNLRFHDYTDFLRTYLIELEASKQTTHDLESKAVAFVKAQKKPSTTKFLLYFGIVYSIGIMAFWFFIPLP